MGIEPTEDSCEPSTDFEDQGRHQATVASSVNASQGDHTRLAVVDRKRSGVQLNEHLELSRNARGYLPQVPAGETSTIFKQATLHRFAVLVFDDETRT